MNKNKKIMIFVISVVLMLVGIATFTIFKYKSDKNAKINVDKIVSVNVIDGIMNISYDMTDEEIELVKDTFPKLAFKEEGKMPKYHTCVVIKTESGKEYMLKYSDTEDMLYLTGDMQNGYYGGAAPLVDTLVKYEKQYGHGTMITYGG
ncbi:MAG: hypothetical protein IIY18_01825 [Clostridia bacterium]|nr:hypothetical protein [Clostridia bacterium]